MSIKDTVYMRPCSFHFKCDLLLLLVGAGVC